MARRRPPARRVRARSDDLPELLANARQATQDVTVLRGRLRAALAAQTDAFVRAFEGGATHDELGQAAGNYQPKAKGYVAPPLRRARRG